MQIPSATCANVNFFTIPIKHLFHLSSKTTAHPRNTHSDAATDTFPRSPSSSILTVILPNEASVPRCRSISTPSTYCVLRSSDAFANASSRSAGFLHVVILPTCIARHPGSAAHKFPRPYSVPHHPHASTIMIENTIAPARCASSSACPSPATAPPYHRHR